MQTLKRPMRELVNIDISVQDAARPLGGTRGRSLAVIQQDGYFEGVVTEKDIVADGVAFGGDPALLRVGELTWHSIATVEADEGAAAVLKRMRHSQAHKLPVLKEGILVGVVIDTDISTFFLARTDLMVLSA